MALSWDDKETVVHQLYHVLKSKGNTYLRISRHALEKRAMEFIQSVYTLFFPDHVVIPEQEKDFLNWLTQQATEVEEKIVHLLHPITCYDSGGKALGICEEAGGCRTHADALIRKMPEIRRLISFDVTAVYEGDPAATGKEEVIMAYPGIFAVVVYRVAHELLNQGVQVIPRMLTECAHMVTGIDIHPGAKIGKGFFIDHGTGVVIGETCEIGDYVKIYQGVTLGALSVPKNRRSAQQADQKRHPTIKDDVTIYAGATILGGKTVIGERVQIGGNVWCTESVPPNSRVLNRPSIEIGTRRKEMKQPSSPERC